MPLPSAESPSQLESSNARANSPNLCIIVDMPSPKGATKASSSNIPPTFNIANILSRETQTEISRSRQNEDDTEINQPILNNRESTPVEAQNITPTVSEADSNHVNNNNYNNSDSDMSLVVLSSETSSNETSFDTTIQIDDSVTSDGERKNESNQNVSVIPSHSRERTAGDSSDTQIAMDALMDALKYHDAQVKLQQAEKAITDLLMKFAEPQDCSPLFDMLANSSILDKTDSDSDEANYSNDIVSPSSVLPILNLLKSQSDPQRSSDLNESSSYGKQLYDLYSPCVFDILRIKLKLYILNKMRLRQSKENGTFSITSTSQSIITTTTVTANTNSSYRDASSPTKYSSHSPVTNNQNNPENAFITYSNNVQNTIEIQANKRDSSCHSVEQSKPPESIINDEERMVTRLQSNNGDVDVDQFTNSVYTNPYHCPLSLLSLVCELEQYREGKHRQGSVMSSERNDSATDNTTETTPSQSENLPNGYNNEESPCSHHLSSLPSKCSTSKTSPTRHHSGKRRQVSSPLEEHNRLNIESEFSQAPSKSRRGSSFRSPKSTVSRQRIEPLNSRAVTSASKIASTSQISRLSCSFPTITLHQSSNFNQQGKWTESGSNVELVNKVGIHGCSSSTPSVSPLSSSVPTRDSSVNHPTRLSDTFWWDSSKRAVSSSITGVDKFQQLSVDVQDYEYKCGDKTPSSVIPRDDCSSSGGTNNPLSTPEIRRNELDLSDLSDGTRVLVIKDTYLLPGTIYMEGDHSPLAIQTSLSSDCLRDQVFRIHLDSEKCNRSTGLRVATDNHFTTSSHSNNTNGTSSRRQSSSLSSPSGCLQTPSTTSNTNCGNTLSGSNRRRQMDLLLYGWQVVQQAVPEVFPASIDHVPPGTRVCAAWSDKLGVNLYPGTVAKALTEFYLLILLIEADSPEDVNRDLVPVDFDDGDHREVPVSGLRILPDYFTNLCELANVTGGEPNIMNGLISSNSVNSVSNAFVSRMRRHSGVDRTIRRLSNHSWSLSETPISLCSSQASTTSVANSTSSLLEDNSYNPNPRVSRTKSFEICGFSNSSDITMGYSVDSGESISDPICIPRAVKTPIVSAPWSILEKYKHRKRRCTYCRSIIRNVDGLVVELGDCVQLRSDGDELYLGKVREIRYNGEKHSPTVVTSWYYEPREAGEDGQLVQHVKGAVFATEHEDENGAECIIRLVKMAKSYGEFLQSCGRRRDDLKILSTDKVPSTSIKDYLQCLQSIQPVDLDETILSDNGDYDGSPRDVFDYFIAGKYDPVLRQVTSWDILLASELNLKLHKKRSNSNHTV